VFTGAAGGELALLPCAPADDPETTSANSRFRGSLAATLLEL